MENLADLQKKCSELGLMIVRTAGRREARRDYVAALRGYYLNRDYPSGLNYQELVPMLCRAYQDLKPKEQAELWVDNNHWLCQEKLNGCRLVIHFTKDLGIHAHSRKATRSNFRFQDLTDRLLFFDFKPDFSATIDSEAVCHVPVKTRAEELTKSTLAATSLLLAIRSETSRRIQSEGAPLIVHCFDITSWEGLDLGQKTLCERQIFLQRFRDAVEKAGLSKHFEFPRSIREGKKQFFDQIVRQGGEGVVFKHLDSLYADNGSRFHRGWVKCKRSLDLIGFVSDFEPGRPESKYAQMIGCVCFSILVSGRPRLVAKVSNLSYEWRKANSIYDPKTGIVRINPSVIGQVAVIRGTEFSGRAARLTHPTITRWRPDLKKEDCHLSVDDFVSLREGATIQPMRLINGEGQ